MTNLLPLFITLPLTAAFLITLLSRLDKRLPAMIGGSTLLLTALLSIFLYFFRPLSDVMVFRMGGWGSPVGINLVLDGLSHLLLLTLNILAFIVIEYAIPYMEKYTSRERFFALFMMMIAGMNGVLLTGDLIDLFIFMELASIASAVLVGFGTQADEMEASFKYITMGTFASLFMLFGIALVYGQTGTVNIAQAAQAMQSAAPTVKGLVIVLFLFGLCTKAAIMPFHAWLPDAHPAAPAPVSAMLSGMLIKTLGIYVIIRIFFNMIGMTFVMSNVLMALGALSIIGGSFLALGQNDMKRLFACSSISQVGFIVLSLGLATPLGVMGGLLHLVNHAMIKPLLFLTAGSVEYATHTRKLDELGGLREKLPITSNASLLGSLAISGIPPLNGFWSKLFILMACIQAGKMWYALVAVIGSIMTLAYFLRVQKIAFFGKPAITYSNLKEVPFRMKATVIVLALMCVLSGLFFPWMISYLINPAVGSVAGGIGYSDAILGGMR